MTITLKGSIKKYFRNSFRKARYLALLNSEDFTPLLHTLETFGGFLNSLSNDDRTEGLYNLKPYLKDFISDSPYLDQMPRDYPVHHSEFEFLYDYVKDTRNEFAHKGVYARQKTRFILELCLIFETKLNQLEMKASNYAVTGATIAELWQPLGFIRKEMLINSYSYIPVYYQGKWHLISDYNLARYLRDTNTKNEKKKRESETVEIACNQKNREKYLKLESAHTFYPEEEISVEEINSTKPILVVDRSDSKKLYGLFTGFDLL